MPNKTHIFVMNGPNLNLLGEREPEVYGHTTLTDIEARFQDLAQGAGWALSFMQSNAEHELVDAIQNAYRHPAKQKFIIINPAAYTHTSIAIRDALLATRMPFIEVHLSNPFAREAFRQQSYLSDCALGVLCGFGAYGYELAFKAAENYFKTTP